ncbi:hypothetical protein KCU70_g58, partial [Aureobasidium melanogenum]
LLPLRCQRSHLRSIRRNLSPAYYLFQRSPESGGLAIAVNLVSVEASWVIASAIATGMLLVEKRVQGGKANHQVCQVQECERY